jgi:thioesterase domain-containing protein
VESFPKTPNGKIDRKALPAPEVSRDPATEAAAPAARNPLEETLVDIWQDVLQVKPIRVTDSFFELGGYSLLAAVLIAKVKERLGHTLPLGALFAAPTIERMAAALEQKVDLETTSLVVPLQAHGSRPPLFVISGLGHVFMYQSIARLLGPDQPVYGLKAVGIDGKEKPFNRVEDMARRFKADILSLRLQGPISLCGFSFGGMVAFELASQLQAEGHPVHRLALLDSFGPAYPVPLPAYKRILIHAANLYRGGLSKLMPYLRDRYNKLKWRILFWLGALHLCAPQIKGAEESTEKRFQKVWAAFTIAEKIYQPAGRYLGKVLILTAQQQAQWVGYRSDDPLLGWGKWLGGDVDIRTVPGNHTDIIAEENVGIVADALKQELGIP